MRKLIKTGGGEDVKDAFHSKEFFGLFNHDLMDENRKLKADVELLQNEIRRLRTTGKLPGEGEEMTGYEKVILESERSFVNN